MMHFQDEIRIHLLFKQSHLEAKILGTLYNFINQNMSNCFQLLQQSNL